MAAAIELTAWSDKILLVGSSCCPSRCGSSGYRIGNSAADRIPLTQPVCNIGHRSSAGDVRRILRSNASRGIGSIKRKPRKGQIGTVVCRLIISAFCYRMREKCHLDLLENTKSQMSDAKHAKALDWVGSFCMPANRRASRTPLSKPNHLYGIYHYACLIISLQA